MKGQEDYYRHRKAHDEVIRLHPLAGTIHDKGNHRQIADED